MMTKSDAVTLRQYVEQIFHERDRLYLEKIEALEGSVADRFRWLEESSKALAESMNHRLAGMNEIKAMAADAGVNATNMFNQQNLTFARKGELEIWQRSVEADLRFLRESRSNTEGESEVKGKASQTAVNVTFTLAALSAICAVAAIVITLLNK